MKKKLLIAAAVILGIIVVGSVVLKLNLNSITETGVTKGGSVLLDVPVTLDDANVSLIRSSVGLDGLALGSPEGFEAPEMFEAGNIYVDAKVMSFMGEKIVVRKVIVDSPEVTFEVAGGKANWSVLMNQVQSKSETDEPPKDELEKKTRKKKMRIDHIVVKNGKVSLAGIPMVDKKTIQLPEVALYDVGKEREAKKLPETIYVVVRGLYKAILKNVGEVLPGDQMKKLTTDVSGAIEEVAGNIRNSGNEAGGDKKESIKNSVGNAAEKGKEAIGDLLGGDKNKEND